MDEAMKKREQSRTLAEATLAEYDIADVQSAYDEVHREYQVRERCFPRWEKEGRISKSDAKDRLHRQLIAGKLLYLLLDSKGADMPDSTPF